MKYTMALRWKGGDPIAQGESQPGEGWKDTLLRLFRQAKDDGIRRSVYLMPDDGGEGEGIRSVQLWREAGPVGGMQHEVEQLIVETDPPEFAPPQAEGSSRIL